MKKCPYCAEEIQDEAIKCRYCLEFLDVDTPISDQKLSQPNAKKKRESTSGSIDPVEIYKQRSGMVNKQDKSEKDQFTRIQKNINKGNTQKQINISKGQTQMRNISSNKVANTASNHTEVNHLISWVFITLGMLSLMSFLNYISSGQSPGSTFISGSSLLLGGIALRSIKNSRYGIGTDSDWRLAYQIALVSLICIITFWQDNYLESVAIEPVSNLIIPTIVLIFLTIEWIKPKIV